MADLISRQDAIDVVRNYYDPEDYSTESIEDRLKRLPTVQPEKVCVAEIKIYGEELQRCVDRAVERLKEEVQTDRWIPCSERLPDKCQVVLLSINDGAIYSTVDYWTGDKFDGFDGDAVAWMPLPSPYKGEQ